MSEIIFFQPKKINKRNKISKTFWKKLFFRVLETRIPLVMKVFLCPHWPGSPHLTQHSNRCVVRNLNTRVSEIFQVLHHGLVQCRLLAVQAGAAQSVTSRADWSSLVRGTTWSKTFERSHCVTRPVSTDHTRYTPEIVTVLHELWGENVIVVR